MERLLVLLNIIFEEAQIYVCNKALHKFLFSDWNKLWL